MTEKLLPDGSYLSKIYEMLNRIEQQEQEPMEAAAEAAYHSIKNGGLLHVFSTGHSHMIVEEMFYRSGGLVPISPTVHRHRNPWSAALPPRQSHPSSNLRKEFPHRRP